MSGPSNETEAEALQRRQVEALEKIAKALTTLSEAVDIDALDRTVLRVKET